MDEVGGIDPVIGLQFFKENSWCTNGSLFSAKNEASFGGVGASAFQVNTTIPCNMPFPIGSVGTWFSGYTFGGPNACKEQPNPLTGLGEGKESLSWSEQYEWYKTILTRGAVNDFETDLMEYALTTSIPSLCEIEKQISIALGSPDDDWSDVQNDIDLIASLNETKAEYISSLGGTPPNEDQMLEIAELANDIQVALDNLFGVLQAQTAEAKSTLEGIIPLLSAVSVNNVQDQTYKALLQLRLDAALAPEGNTDYYETARDLSSLDESVYGCAVGKAHHYLPQDEFALYISGITDLCLEGQENEEISSEEPVVANWDVKKADEHNYIITLESNENETYGVFDVSGKLIIKGTLTTGSNSIGLNSLLPGHYIIKGSRSTHLHRIFIAN